jgi:hypothetical protein
MSYSFYKIMHILGVFATLVGLAVTATHAALGGTRADNPMRKLLGAVHGIALLLVLTGGFGMLARLGAMHGALPTWVFVKLAIWVAFAGAIALPYLSRGWARALLVLLPLLAALGGATALLKPFS